jgi:hypothetical protein
MLTIVRWIHVCSVAMLVGGMTFVFFALRPALSRHSEEPGVKGASSFVRTRFRTIAILLTTVLVASGIVNIVIAPPKGWFIVVLIVKVLAAGAVLLLYFRNAFAKVPVSGSPEPSPRPPTAAPDTGGPSKKVPEWRTAWLLAPTPSQVRMELVLIAGAMLVILLGVILSCS